jgi:ribonuclease-3
MDTKDPATTPDADPLDRVEAALGRAFRDRSLLARAFVHPSWSCEHPGEASNQRLEFLGDAVVGLLLARALFERFPDADEGALTRLRAELASGEALGRRAAALGFGAALRLGRGQTRGGGAENLHNLADAFEAAFGAVLLDGGFEAAEDVFRRLFAEDVAALAAVPAGGESPKSALQIETARRFREAPAYRIVSRTGPDSAPSFVAEASAAGRSATGEGRSKQAAETAAAAALLALLSASR